MKQLHPFFIIGTVGMLVSAGLHIFMALGLEMTSVHSLFYANYSIFAVFLVLGTGFILKAEKVEDE